MFDLVAMMKDHNVDFLTRHSELTQGRIAVQCPWCGDAKHHGSFHTETLQYHCWRCGGHGSEYTLAKILGKRFDGVRSEVRKYYSSTLQSEEVAYRKDIVLPANEGKLNDDARSYISESRGFDPDELESIYGLVSAENSDDVWQNRILMPIHKGGKLVSYSSRDISGTRQDKARSCKKEDSVVHYKDTLYNFDRAVKNDRVIVVEGPWGVFRLGSHSVATFGTFVTEAQKQMLATCWEMVVIAFDGGESEGKAQSKAQRLARELSGSTEIAVADIGCEPEDIGQEFVGELISNLIGVED